jgi:hypothetical protein
VETGDLVLARRARLHGYEMVRKSGDIEEIAKAPLGRRIFGMDVRLDGETGREDGGIVAGIVPQIELVKNETGGHGLPFSENRALRTGS